MNMKADVTRRTLLDVQGLHTVFEKDGNEVHAVNQVSFDVKEGEILAIVGESGSGKIITAMSLLRLIPSPPGRIVGGRVLFNDQDLLDLDDEQIRRLRGRDIAMIFQEPMTSLNPSLRIGRQLAEPLRVHGSVPKEKVRERCLELLRQVRLGDPEKRLDAYPHELSGGMRQRVMIAIGLACLPKLLRPLSHLRAADSVFLINSVVGVLPVRKLAQWVWPVTEPVRQFQEDFEVLFS